MLSNYAVMRIDPDKAAAKRFRLFVHLVDRKETILVTVGNGLMVHEHGVTAAKADATFTMARPHLLMTLFAGAPVQSFIESGEVKAEGDASLLAVLAEMIEPLNTNFNIVTPQCLKCFISWEHRCQLCVFFNIENKTTLIKYNHSVDCCDHRLQTSVI